MITKSLAEEFYIIQTKPEWFQLRLKFNKECISTATSLDGILNNLRTIAERYEDGDTLRRAWNGTDFKKPSEMTDDYNTKQYDIHKDDFRTEIENTIADERKVNMKNSLVSPKKKVKMLKPKITLPEIEDDVLDDAPIKPLKPKLKKKLITKKNK